jgi:ribosomal protein S18 acetylase RimI-like enzyme
MVRHLLLDGQRLGAVRPNLEVCTSNRPAVRLYRALGFRAVGVARYYYPAPGAKDKCLSHGAGHPPTPRLRSASHPGARARTAKLARCFHNAAISDILRLKGAVRPMPHAG